MHMIDGLVVVVDRRGMTGLLPVYCLYGSNKSVYSLGFLL